MRTKIGLGTPDAFFRFPGENHSKEQKNNFPIDAPTTFE
jgi:hypothetical protein